MTIFLERHCPRRSALNILRNPPETLTIPYTINTLAMTPQSIITSNPTLSHNHTAHKHLDRPDAFERHLPLARRLIQSQLMPHLILTHSVRMIDFIPQDQERHFGQVFHGQERVELGFGFGETFEVFGVDEEDDAGYFGEVVLPETAGCGEVVSLVDWMGSMMLTCGRGGVPCWWPPRSKVVNLQFPMASSSDAGVRCQNRWCLTRMPPVTMSSRGYSGTYLGGASAAVRRLGHSTRGRTRSARIAR